MASLVDERDREDALALGAADLEGVLLAVARVGGGLEIDGALTLGSGGGARDSGGRAVVEGRAELEADGADGAVEGAVQKVLPGVKLGDGDRLANPGEVGLRGRGGHGGTEESGGDGGGETHLDGRFGFVA